MTYYGTATYSFEDDKLRFYPDASRLPEEQYQKVKQAGFIWAPAQKLFVQVWSPEREDLLLDLAGDIDDEATSAEDRAWNRAERFEQYSKNAEKRGEEAQDQAQEMAGGIPLGQPILVGHHSERKARKMAERIEGTISRAVDEFKKTDYWRNRARRVVAHEARHDRPDVVYRRIKTLETNLRKYERMANPKSADWVCQSLWLREDGKSIEEIGQVWADREKQATRWIEHIENRLIYEREIYQLTGGVPADASPLEVGGAVYHFGKWHKILRVNRHQGQITSVSVSSGYSWADKIPLDKIQAIKSREEYEALLGGATTEQDIALASSGPRYKAPEPKRWEELEKTVVEAVGDVPGFYPTPPDIIARVIEKAKIEPALFVLEPSAGKGDIADALRARGCAVTCVELDVRLAEILRKKRHKVFQQNFLVFNEGGSFYNRAIMNPPFGNLQELDHVYHAYDLLLPGGILVAILPESPFFQENKKAAAFRQWLEERDADIEELPAGAFHDSGTEVKTRIVTVKKHA